MFWEIVSLSDSSEVQVTVFREGEVFGTVKCECDWQLNDKDDMWQTVNWFSILSVLENCSIYWPIVNLKLTTLVY